MAEGPYRYVEIEETHSPPGIVFFGTDERLSVEVKRTLPAVAAGATLIAAMVVVGVTRDWSNLLAEAVVVGNAGYWVWPRLRRTSRLTSIEMHGGQAKFVQVNVLGRDEKTIPVKQLGLPRIGEIKIERARLPDLRLRCLQFDHYLDGVRGGQSLPLQILAGYRLDRLQWLCKNVGTWMRNFAGVAP